MMPKRNGILTNLILIIVAGTIFLMSARFNNEQNSVKWFIWEFGIIAWFIISLMCVKEIKQLSCDLFSHRILKCLLFIGTIQALYILIQFFEILPSNHDYLKVTGSFDNPAGAVSLLALLFPVGVHLKCHSNGRKRLCVVIQLLFYIVAIVACQSRTGLIAVVLSTSVYFLVEHSSFRRFVTRPLVICCIAVIGVVATYAIFKWKADSSNGRLLILLVSLGMISRKPLFGYGPHGFTANYMVNQADFFANNPDSSYSILADNIIHPFNEYVNITVNYGLIGLVVFIGVWIILAVVLVRHKDKGIGLWLAVLAAFAVLCAFSYPLHYAHVWFVMQMLAVYSLRIFIPQERHWVVRIPVILVCLVGLMGLGCVVRNELRWKIVQDKALEGYSFTMQKYYDKLYPKMKRNHLFLYNYAAEQNICGMYAESLQTTMESQKKLNDYEVQLLLADNYENIGDSAMAVAAYSLAHDMIPSRFVPLYCLMDFYNLCGDSVTALNYAIQILEKPVKIPSDAINSMKDEARVLTR